MKLEEHVEEFVKDFFLPDVCDSMVLEFECNEYSLREGLPELLTAYAKQEVERERERVWKILIEIIPVTARNSPEENERNNAIRVDFNLALTPNTK